MAEMFTAAERSRVMRAVRGSDTAAEGRLRELLRLLPTRIRFREQANELPGCPDFVNHRLRIAVFVDGDFWHGRWWRRGGKVPIANRAYWLAKFRRNRERDRQADRSLRRHGWAVIRVWESDLFRRPDAVGVEFLRRLRKRRAAVRRRSGASCRARRGSRVASRVAIPQLSPGSGKGQPVTLARPPRCNARRGDSGIPQGRWCAFYGRPTEAAAQRLVAVTEPA
jgi:DNA mismatch endonuclease (patch repair protein)